MIGFAALGDYATNDMRLAVKAYSEIAAVLRLLTGEPNEAVRWMHLSVAITKSSNSTCEDPSWSHAVDARLAEHGTENLKKTTFGRTAFRQKGRNNALEGEESKSNGGTQALHTPD